MTRKKVTKAQASAAAKRAFKIFKKVQVPIGGATKGISLATKGLRSISRKAARTGFRHTPSELSKTITQVVKSRIKRGAIGKRLPTGLTREARAEYRRILNKLSKKKK